MALALLFKKQRASIDSLTLDASVKETHSTEIEVTDHPVEQGANITDHRRRKPFQLTLEGLVSNTPLPQDGDPMLSVTSQGVTWSSRSKADPTAALSAYKTLLDLADTSRLLTVVTALQVYRNMTITSLSVPRDASTGQVLRFTATLREIRIVRNDTIVLSAKTTRAHAATDLHKKAKTEVTPEQKNQTLARYLLEGDATKDVKNAVGSLAQLIGIH